MTEKRSRVHYIDTDKNGKDRSQDTLVLGKRDQPAITNERSSERTSVADLFAEDKIMDRLPDYAQERYEDMAPAGLRLDYAHSLSKVMRWKGSNGGEIIDPDFEESDLDHVLELIDWMNIIENKYPLLWQEVCGGSREVWMDLMAMLILHDAGEIVVGDLRRTHPEFNAKFGKLHKKRESKTAVMMIRKSLPNHADLLIGQYNRFEKRNTDDKLVMLGHVLDKAQATQNVAKHILPFCSGDDGLDLCEYSVDSQSAVLPFAEHLTEHISDEAGRELFNFLDKKVFKVFENLKSLDLRKSQLMLRTRYVKFFEGIQSANN